MNRLLCTFKISAVLLLVGILVCATPGSASAWIPINGVQAMEEAPTVELLRSDYNAVALNVSISGFNSEIIETENGAAMGLKIPIGDSRTPLLIIRAEKGYLACGYFTPETIKKEQDAACITRGVKNFREMLEKRVTWVSPKARELGVKATMTGAQALDKMI